MEKILEQILSGLVNLVLGLISAVAGFTMDRIAPAVLIFVVGLAVILVVMAILKKVFAKTKMEAPMLNLLLAVIRGVLILLLSLITASSLGIDVTGVIALASVLTLAVSLAVQTALTNLIGGFTLLYTKPFRVGDVAEVGGQCGTVLQVGLTYTKLLTVDSKTVSIPNSTVVASQIINYTVAGIRRVDIEVNVAYSNDPELVLEALREAGQVPTALEDPAPYAAVVAYRESTVGYVLQVWTKPEDYWTTLHQANKNIRAVFKEKNVALSFPHLNVHLDR